MSRTKSSNLAKLKDQIKWFAEAIEDLGKELEQYRSDSDRLKELEPALARVKAVLSPSTTPEKSLDESLRAGESSVPPPVNREKHPRKKKESIPPEEPPQQ